MTPATILVIDDDPAQLQLSETLLSHAGYTVLTAGGAEEAFSRAHAQKPDAIVSDVLMIEMDGFTLCGRFRSEPAFRDVPVVLVSSYFNGEDDRKLAMTAGATALVERTPMFEAEIAALRHVLESHPPPFVEEPGVQESYMRRMAVRMEQLLTEARRSELKYRTLFDHASEAVSVSSLDGTLLDVNHRWVEILDRSRDEIVGRHIREFAAFGHKERNVEQYRAAVDEGVTRPMVFPVVRRDGSTVLMEISNTVVGLDGESLVFSIGHDVTETVETSRKLEASERQYRFLVENTPDVVWLGTLEGALLFASPQAHAMFGFTPAELTAGAPALLFARIHPRDVERVGVEYAALTAGQPYMTEFQWRHKDERWLWVRLRAVVRVAEDGRPIVEGTCADVTEQKRLEELVRQSQKMEAIGQLTGGIAHDFNNILAIILGNGRMLLDELDAGDPRREDADAIIEAGERASSLTRQLLTFSRKQVVQPKRLEIDTTIRGLEKMLRRVVSENIDLSIVTADSLGTVLADPGEIEQVIMNLVVNARDAMPSGGHVRIDTANVDLDQEYAQTHVDAVPGRYVVLTVSDTGCGMDAETRHRLFEPFFTTKEAGRGTGLGLSTCYGIVKRCKGHIWVYSEPGYGSTFKVYLPRVDAAANQAQPVAEPSDTIQGTETVLIVEDDEQLRKTVARILKRRGYHVLAAADGREAMAIVEAGASPIDLVVSDVIMPGLSGPDIVEAIRARSPRTRALLMSGYTDHPQLRDGVAAGVNFIQKPFAPQALAAKVREVLNA